LIVPAAAASYGIVRHEEGSPNDVVIAIAQAFAEHGELAPWPVHD
jgi:hypothetical protein